MSGSTVPKTEEVKTEELSPAGTEGLASEVVQPSAPVEMPPETLKTTELLKRWPTVLVAIHRGRDAYCSVKKSAGIIDWSFNLTEKAVGSVIKFAESKVIGLRPLIQYADKTVSEGVKVIEKKFPVVMESPEKLYDSIKQEITKIVRPALDKTASISELGRKKLNRAAKKIMEQYHALIRTVDSWLDTLEKKLNGATPEAEPGAAVPAEAAAVTAAEAPESSAQSGRAGRLRQALQLGAGAAGAVAAFQVGAAFWLLARVPLVGRFFRETPDSSPSSSGGAPSSSSSSARLSPPAAAEEPPLSIQPEPSTYLQK